MLTYSEKCIRKLQENFACFHDKLHEKDVYDSFMVITNGAKKFAKPEAKVIKDPNRFSNACVFILMYALK